MSTIFDVASSAPAYAVDRRALIPQAWLATETEDQFHLYNPALIAFRGRRLFAYRLDSSRDGPRHRRIAICALDEQWRVIPGTVVPFSDLITEGDRGHYDPRFFVYGDRLFIHYNNCLQTRPNQIFLVEVDADTLWAKGAPRPLLLEGPRDEIEKNWMLFEHEGEVLAVYTIAPHVILRVALTATGPIVCTPTFTSKWDVTGYTRRYGELRGGAPPIRYGDLYLSVVHSHRVVGALRHLLPFFPDWLMQSSPPYPARVIRRIRIRCHQRRYYGGLYAFAATPPFQPVWLAHAPILRPEIELPRQQQRWADPTSELAVYPTGALLLDEQRLLVAYGVHEERCCLRRIDLTQVTKTWEAA